MSGRVLEPLLIDTPPARVRLGWKMRACGEAARGDRHRGRWRDPTDQELVHQGWLDAVHVEKDPDQTRVLARKTARRTEVSADIVGRLA